METLSESDQLQIEAIVPLMHQARSLLFITGAGLSADSGLPTYRGVGGLYEHQAPSEGLPIETLLSGEMLKRRPEWTWKYLSEIETTCRKATYNRSHQILAALEPYFSRVCILTQNVDGFHQKAGSKDVIDLHGDFHTLLCTDCPWREQVRDYSHLDWPPLCPQCQAIVRPDVVLFGEWLPWQKLLRWEEEARQGFDLIFSIGTSSIFPYISQPIREAFFHGIPTIEINPELTQVSEAMTFRLRTRAIIALEALWQKFQPSS